MGRKERKVAESLRRILQEARWSEFDVEEETDYDDDSDDEPCEWNADDGVLPAIKEGISFSGEIVSQEKVGDFTYFNNL